MLTIAPPPRSSIARISYFMHRKIDLRLTATSRSNVASSQSASSVGLGLDRGHVGGAVEAAVSCPRLRDRRLDVGRLRHVGAHEHRLAAVAADQLDGLLAAVVGDVGDDDPGAGRGEGQRRRAAHAAGGAGDQRDLAGRTSLRS